MSEPDLGYIPIDIPRSPLQDFAEECGKLLAPDEYLEAGTITKTRQSSVGEFPSSTHWLVFGINESQVMIGSISPHNLESLKPASWIDSFHSAREDGIINPLGGTWEWPGFFVRYTYGGQPGWVNSAFQYPQRCKNEST